VKQQARYVVKLAHVMGINIHRLEVNMSTMFSRSVFVFGTRATICLFADIANYRIYHITL